MPEEEHRRRLWERNLPPAVPQSDDIDLDFLRPQVQAVRRQHPEHLRRRGVPRRGRRPRRSSMSDLIRATEREYQKLGRLTVEAEFGQYMAMTRAAG